MNSTIWNTICTNWNASQYCDLSNQTAKLTFTVQVPTSLTQLFNNIVIFKVANVSLPNSDFVYPICPESISTQCSIDCNNYNINDIIGDSGFSDNEVYGLYQFWVFLMLMIAAWLGQAVVVSIGDAICFEMLGETFFCLLLYIKER